MSQPNRPILDYRAIITIITALCMPVLMILLGVWIEQKFGDIDSNSDAIYQNTNEINEIKDILPQLLELRETIGRYQQEIAALAQVRDELREIRATEQTIQSIQQVINARVDNAGVQMSGVKQRLDLLDERLDTIERRE